MARVDDDRIEAMVRQAAPEVVLGPPVDLRRALEVLAADIVAAEPRKAPAGVGSLAERRGRRRYRVPVLAGVAVLTAAAGFAQWYDTSTPDFAQVLEQYTDEVPLPPGTDAEAYVAHVRSQGLERPGQVSDTGVRSMVAYYGVCTWLTAWEARTEAGDAAATAEALDALTEAVASPALAVTDGGGVVANLERVVAAAARGDRGIVATELGNNCSTLPLDGIR